MWRRFFTTISTPTHPATVALRSSLGLSLPRFSASSGNVDIWKGAVSYYSIGTKEESLVHSKENGIASVTSYHKGPSSYLSQLSPLGHSFQRRFVATIGSLGDTVSQDASASNSLVTPHIKFKRLDKTAKHIMQILDKEAVEEVKTQREILDIRPGYILQLKVEVPENKRRVSIIKGIVIARRNAGLNTTFRLRRLVAGVGVESVFHLYSPNIKEVKVVDKKKVRRAKLYYLRDRMNALKKQ
ncbi:hypothetical protein DM860_007501 [Cuscuta australis]|uniref:Ribosomal protein L19 n=1 Tax=Cuscuta australis TaxID=267555 RepID=A0A328E8A1_9ASTE|nr:hypothetical protein DM860_007501 [Cuscuta australis]